MTVWGDEHWRAMFATMMGVGLLENVHMRRYA